MKNSKKGFVTVILSVIIVILIVIFGAYIYLQNKKSSKQTKLSQGLEIPNNVSGVLFKNPVNIKELPLKTTWENDPFSYTLKNAYLVPHIADLSRYQLYLHDEQDIEDRSFVIIEISTRNVSTSGDKQVIDVADNFRLRESTSTEIVPIDPQYTSLNPQEDLGKTFVYFPVKNNESQFTLLV